MQLGNEDVHPLARLWQWLRNQLTVGPGVDATTSIATVKDPCEACIGAPCDK
jgi:hypothetical protein